MPPRRKRRHSLKTQITRTRLIEISIKVEDCVYNKKPISEAEAEMFIKEVTSYKVECSRDERSLQVIEKLLRCMKAIIAEHQERSLDDYTYEEGYQLDNGPPSPVYSLPDEDRTQMSQEVELQTCLNRNAVYTFNETQFTKDIDKHDEESNDNVQTKTSNHFNEYEIKTFTQPFHSNRNIHTVNVDIHKALSNLSLKSVNEDEIMTADIECSQSILKNFHELDNQQQNSTLNVESTYRKDMKGAAEEVKTTVTHRELQDIGIQLSTNIVSITDSSQIKRSGIDEEEKRLVKATEDVNKKPNLLKQPMHNISNFNNTSKSDKKSDSIKIISVQKVARKDAKIAQVNKTSDKAHLKYTPGVFSNIIEGRHVNVTSGYPFERRGDITNTLMRNSDTKMNLQENVTNQNSITSNKKKKKPRKKKETEGKHNKIGKNLVIKSKDIENHIKNKSKTANRKKNKHNLNQKDDIVPIYNNNIENDLSWLEGIRFVREIREDEYDSKLKALNEDFWDNYYLPPNFDDEDFL